MKRDTHSQQRNIVRTISEQQEQPFSDDQTTWLKSTMASAVAEAMASTNKPDTQDQPKDGDEPLTSAGE